MTESRFLALDEAVCEACIANHPDVSSAFITQLREQFARLRDHATDLGFKTPFERLASVLFELRRWPGATLDEQGADTVRIPVRRSDIANYIGIKPETVSRAIRQLEQERLIGLPCGDRVVLADIPSMRRLANGGRPRQSHGGCDGLLLGLEHRLVDGAIEEGVEEPRQPRPHVLELGRARPPDSFGPRPRADVVDTEATSQRILLKNPGERNARL